MKIVLKSKLNAFLYAKCFVSKNFLGTSLCNFFEQPVQKLQINFENLVQDEHCNIKFCDS